MTRLQDIMIISAYHAVLIVKSFPKSLWLRVLPILLIVKMYWKEKGKHIRLLFIYFKIYFRCKSGSVVSFQESALVGRLIYWVTGHNIQHLTTTHPSHSPTTHTHTHTPTTTHSSPPPIIFPYSFQEIQFSRIYQ